MIKKLLQTESEIVYTILRIVLAVVIFPHGAQKALGWFDGYGYTASMTFLMQTVSVPWYIAFCAILAEFIGPVLLVLGLFTRLAAFAIGVNMVVAIAVVHRHNGFFMNWMGNLKGEGYEFHILVLSIVVALLIRGAGAFSVDHKLTVLE